MCYIKWRWALLTGAHRHFGKCLIVMCNVFFSYLCIKSSFLYNLMLKYAAMVLNYSRCPCVASVKKNICVIFNEECIYHIKSIKIKRITSNCIHCIYFYATYNWNHQVGLTITKTICNYHSMSDLVEHKELCRT